MRLILCHYRRFRRILHSQTAAQHPAMAGHRKYETKPTQNAFHQQTLVENYSPEWRKLTKTIITTLDVELWWFATMLVSVCLLAHLASDTVNLVLGRKYEGRITYITFRQQILVGNYSPKWRKLTKTSVATLGVILWWFAVVSLSAGLCIQCHIRQSGAGPAIRR